MKIGILSDTHGKLSSHFEKELSTCDAVIHAGDIDNEKCYLRLKALQKPLYMIRGNCDHGRYAAYLPESLSFHIQGLRFFLIHNLSNAPFKLEDTDILVSGHTHSYACFKQRGITYLNPGSAGRSRDGMGDSMAILQWDGRNFDIQRFR